TPFPLRCYTRRVFDALLATSVGPAAGFPKPAVFLPRPTPIPQDGAGVLRRQRQTPSTKSAPAVRPASRVARTQGRPDPHLEIALLLEIQLDEKLLDESWLDVTNDRSEVPV